MTTASLANTNNSPTLAALIGPTACGKSALALALAKKLPLEIITMDSGQVYRGLNIGTAKPSLAEQALVRHHLLDLVEPEERYSAGRFCRDVALAVADIRGRGKMPLVVGGTMMYYKALRNGLSILPTANSAFRQELSTQAALHGWPYVHAQLRAQDSEAAATIHPQDALRIQRAMEIIHLTGQTLAKARAHREPPLFSLCTLALLPPQEGGKSYLQANIRQRLARMLKEGFVAEVAQLRQRPAVHKNSPGLCRVGYANVWDYLDGRFDEQEMIARIEIETWQLARRQIQWLRSFSELEKLYVTDDTRAMEEDAHKYLKRFNI